MSTPSAIRDLVTYYRTCLVMLLLCVVTFYTMDDVWTLAGAVVALHASVWFFMWRKTARTIYLERVRLRHDAERRELVRDGKVVELAVRRAEDGAS